VVYFFELLTPYTLGGRNFPNFISFLTIFNAPIRRFQIWTPKATEPPLGSGLPLAHKCSVIG